MLVLEDLHWADDATLDVTRLVARRIEESPSLFVASSRDEELSPTIPFGSFSASCPRATA